MIKRNGVSTHEILAEIVQFRDILECLRPPIDSTFISSSNTTDELSEAPDEIVIVPPVKRVKLDIPIVNVFD